MPGERQNELHDKLNVSMPPPQGAGRGSRASATEDFVHVPIRPGVSKGKVIVEYELRESSDGPPFLPVFTREEDLVDQLGDLQTRMEVPFREVINEVGGDQGRDQAGRRG